VLFASCAAVESATGRERLDELRGVARRAPWAGAGLVVGALTLAGLPLTAGFTSEWLVLEALMQQFRVTSLPMQLAAAFAGALVALTVGVAGVTFVRLIGLTAFGSPSTELTAREEGRRLTTRGALGLLAGACLAVSAVAPLEVRLIAAGLRPVVGARTLSALSRPWVIAPVYGDFSALSPSWLWLALPALTLVAGISAVLLSGRRLFRVRRVPAWSSAASGVDRGVGYSSFAYANPMRKVLANVLLTSSQLDEVRAEQAAPTRAGPRRPVPSRAAELGPDSDMNEPIAARPPTLTYRVDVVEVVERFLYRPAATAVMTVSRVARRLQSGRLDAYMAYMLIAVVAVLAVVAAAK